MSPAPNSDGLSGAGGGDEREAKPGRDWLLAALAVVSLAALVLGRGMLLVAAVPVLATTMVWALWKLSLRKSASILIFLLLSLDRSEDAQGVWHTPLAGLGDLLSGNIDAVIPALRGFKLNGAELLVFTLLGFEAARRARGAPGAERPKVPVASASRGSLVLLCAGIAFATVNGLATGGSSRIAIWQARPLFDIALFFLLFREAYGRAQDYVLLGKIIVLSASVKALFGLFILLVVAPRTGSMKWEYTTNHGDSVLFSVACVVLLADLMERTDWRRIRQCLLALPLLVLGIVANNRRLAWVELGFSLAVIYFASPRRRWKRVLNRAVLLMGAPFLLYVAAGWDSTSRAFGPVATVRSIVDTKKDRSSWDRDVENYNLALSMKPSPLLGLGFGHEWTEHYKGDDILAFFPDYHAEPHNQTLGLMLFMGPLGFTAAWGFFSTAVFLAMRSYWRSTNPIERAAALVCFACVVSSMVQSYGDLGPFFTQPKVFTALAATIAGKLAVATGAWPSRRRIESGSP